MQYVSLQIKFQNSNTKMSRSLTQHQFSYREFTTRFKLIRHQRDYHFHDHLLMRDTLTKKKVIVKNHVYEDTKELKAIINDYNKLIRLHEQGKSSQFICEFIGYCLQQSSQPKQNNVEEIEETNSINLIYGYNENTLAEQLSNMKLHHEKFTQKQINCFISHMILALAGLQDNGYSHQCLNFNYVLVQEKGNIDMKFMLIFTPFLGSSIQQIQQQKANVQDYNLSQIQLKILSDNTINKGMEDISISQKLKSDKQSLGLMALRMASIQMRVNSSLSQKLYEMNQNYELTWNASLLKQKLLYLSNNYSKDLYQQVQYLLFDRGFYSFKDLPKNIFEKGSIANSNYSSRKRITSNQHERYSPLYKNNDNKLDMSRQSRLTQKSRSKSRSQSRSNSVNKKRYQFRNPNQIQSKKNSRISQSPIVPHPVNISELSGIKHEEQNNTEQRLFPISNKQSPTKKKKSDYQRLLKQLQGNIIEKIPKHTLHKLEDTVTKQIYIGQIQNGKKQGLGLNYGREGDVYGGEWHDNQMQGQGIYLFSNCDIYTGKVFKGLKHGQGKYEHWNGNYYEGMWKNDYKNGKGKYQNKNKGESYEGEFENNMRHGFGIYWHNNGDRYEGQFEKGFKNGNGVYYKNKSNSRNYNEMYMKYKGRWKDDKLQDNIIIEYIHSGHILKLFPTSQDINNKENVSLNGKIEEENIEGFRFKGEYKDRKRNGYCEIIYPNGDKYSGNIVNDKFEGNGKYFYQYLGYEYAGMWKNNKQQGEGTVKFKNGTEIQCQWNEGKPQKFGKIKYQNGDEYIGQISGLGRNGRGTYVSRNGERLKGIFRNGIFVSND